MSFRTGTPADAGMSETRIATLHQQAEKMVEANVTSAQVYVAARRGIIVAHKASGRFGPEPEAPPLTTEALFPLCSITKVITAACLMMLVEQGEVGLNRPVVDYIPELSGEGAREIRVHHLLTHTSGISPEDLSAHVDLIQDTIQLPPHAANQDPDTHRWLYLGYGVKPGRKPGEAMAYLGYGYELLGEIIRRVSGIAYPEYVRQHLLEPLGMRDTYFIVPESERERIVRRAPEDPCADWIETEDFLQSYSASGGLIGTAMDLAKFGQLFLDNGRWDGRQLLSPVSIREMMRNHIPGVSAFYRDEVFPEASWGLGWGVNGNKRDGGDLFSPAAVSHWGAAGVFIAVDPVYEVVAVHFTVEKDLRKPFKNMYTDYFNNTVLAAITDI
ncbi:CubicO group peptidase (beta-lactamase class C family) [Paenibacillus phyllosphaerae]|uniref:CubicO group peptidase (Beta-lactamase class C family) n=1 Tax=Paenibacillus phyllosphaerae TaxID=274593 RepID=A0A7W5FMJ4_9BACL|nr:serine hydrolase domain-containing protein [Paenibacillus phyllosphaerae]MBB3110188.1 CubicO group peptidase (beta-lactamase class C family) [Paenibacillus phyllosphaerae]